MKKCSIDTPAIHRDQMSLHQNENVSQKTLAFNALYIYVKENYILYRVKATVFMQTSSDSSIDLKP